MLGAEAPPGTTNCAYLKQPDKQEAASRLVWVCIVVQGAKWVSKEAKIGFVFVRFLD